MSNRTWEQPVKVETSPLRKSTGVFGSIDDPTISKTRITGKMSPLRGR